MERAEEQPQRPPASWDPASWDPAWWDPRPVLHSMRGKLSLAFLGIVLLFSAALISSERGLGRLEGAVDEAYGSAVPTVLRLQELGVRSHELALELRVVAGSRETTDIDAAEAEYQESRARIGEAAAAAGDGGAAFSDALASLDGAAQELFAAARERIESRNRARDVREGLDVRAGRLLNLLEDALILEPETPRQTALEELRVSILLARSTVRATFDAPDPARLAELRERSRSAARRASLQLATLNDRGLERAVADLRSFLLERIQDQPAARARARELAAEVRLDAATDGVAGGARSLERMSAGLSKTLEGQTAVARAEAVAVANGARLTVRGLWFLAFGLSLAIVGLYVRRRIGGRISGLVQDLDRLAAGDLDVEIRSHGDFELARIARSANVFRRNARDLQNSLGALEERNAQLSEFTYVASHDLKSPMRGIANLADWIVEDSEGRLSPESESHLAMLRERVERMESMLEDLLRYSRLGQDAGQREVVDLEKLLRVEFASVEGSAGAVLETEGLGEPLRTYGPPLRLCVRNLLQNALVHSDRDEPRIRALLLAGETPGTRRIVIEDDGPGIDEEKREQAFAMFRRLGHGSTGTGMGLALVRRAVEVIGGEIKIEEAEPRGARFVMTWPVLEDSEDADDKAPVSNPAASAPGE